MSKPSIPQGTRDFSADVVRKRNHIFSTIKNVFEIYGFEPLETPAMENLETLMGKYGEEGDRLIFKILNNGNILKNVNSEMMVEEIIKLLQEEKIITITPTNKVIVNEDFVKDEKYKNNIRNFLGDYIKDKYLSERALRYDLTIPFARYVAMNYTKLTF